MERKPTESVVVEMWERTVASGAKMVTADRQPVRILYPGRPNDEPGADYRDAVISIGGVRKCGNIEVHVRSADWQAHGHHRDPAYNNVILHVVRQHDEDKCTPLENGGAVPVLVVQGRPVQPVVDRRCPAALLPAEEVANRLDRAGDMRFREKTEAFAEELRKLEAGQCLYRGIMGALGYSRNTEAFRNLAEIVPLALLESQPDDIHMEAVLFGAAGLLPSQRPGSRAAIEPYIAALEDIWDHAVTDDVMPAPVWRLTCVRPANYPARRLAGMARLLGQCRGPGLLDRLITLVSRAPVEGAAEQIGDALKVHTQGYWADHYDLGRAARNLPPYLIGHARAVEIAVNVLLPFCAAMGRGPPGLNETALALYRAYPAGEENSILRHMRRQTGLKGAVAGAQRQQGLLHIYKRYCTQGRCRYCLLRM